jgi:hypothetical protein
VRRLLAALVLVVFATLATTDAVACPDGCPSANSTTAADHCNNAGICFFCTGGVVPATAPPVLAPFITQLPVPFLPLCAVPAFSTGVPDHPPRCA